jgi:hypothetical protein
LATRRAMDIVGISTQEQVAQLFPYVFVVWLMVNLTTCFFLTRLQF